MASTLRHFKGFAFVLWILSSSSESGGDSTSPTAADLASSVYCLSIVVWMLVCFFLHGKEGEKQQSGNGEVYLEVIP